MRKAVTAGLLAMMVFAGCAKSEETEEMPADTATMAPAPAPMPMPMDTSMMMDSATHDTMQMHTTTQ